IAVRADFNLRDWRISRPFCSAQEPCPGETITARACDALGESLTPQTVLHKHLDLCNPHNSASIYPSSTACPPTGRTAQDYSASEHNHLRNGAPRRVPKTFLSNSALRCLGFGRGLCMARCTQTARATDQDRTSACAKCFVA